ncbi:nitrile hydratase subunit alpha [Oceanibium sediminis]|uniref:nitrile hydratase subunit alpha n=1 Tax=Oceanibium sediminis TaxID=2026339 RepID=UPI000DD3204E|nr:nitrile hydratase subunit alpha [Oceanibium sediminis]
MHDHDHADNEMDEMTARVRALETILTEKGLVDPTTIDTIVEAMETRIGPRNGARVVARAWVDPDYAARLRSDAVSAVAELGYGGAGGEHMRAVFNDAQTHNLIVCTLCSCYPWPVLGLPPVWYKSPPYRARAVKEPRKVLEEFGVKLPKETKIRVRDSTSEVRYMVVPQRPAGTEGLDEEALAALVTRDSMIGTALVSAP